MSLDTLTQLLQHNENPKQSFAMAAYMKDNFPFFGIPSPKRKEIEKQWIKSLSIISWKQLETLAQSLRDLPQREYHYIAITLLSKYKKLRTSDSIKYFEKMITQNSWWDSVDSIDTNLIGVFFLLFPENKKKYALKRAASKNMWLQRTALQFQLLYKNKTDTALLEAIFQHTKDAKEFFIQKAMGWILREYSKTDGKRVSNYIKTNTLPKLTIREGSKYI